MATRSITLKYGKGKIRFDVPERQLVQEIRGNDRPASADLRADYLRALDHPIDSAPLRAVVRPGDTVAITVSDITRGWQRNADTLAFLLDYLNEAGVPDAKITVIIAVGAHRQNTAEEFVEICGAAVCHRVRVVNHNAWDESAMVYLGETSRGTPVEVNRLAVESDRLILTGGVIYHYMVGYGGGRKSVMPGICSNRTIQTCHLWSLESELGRGRSRMSQSGLTRGNPAHEDMMECASLAQPDFIVNVVPNSDGRICGVFGGNWVSAWQEATRLVDKMYGVPVSARTDIVVATAGGYPKDINLYQVTKTMDNAVQAVRPGGVCIVAAECSDMREPWEFFGWFERPTVEEMDFGLRSNYTIAGWVAMTVREFCRTGPIILLTRPENAEFARQAGLIPAASIEEALATAVGLCGRPDPTITIMPNGANTLPVFKAG